MLPYIYIYMNLIKTTIQFNNILIIGCVWQWSGLDRTQKFKKLLSKSTITFLFFISYQLLFITIQIKKSLQNKIFIFL
jgi:hypothetical protein